MKISTVHELNLILHNTTPGRICISCQRIGLFRPARKILIKGVRLQLRRMSPCKYCHQSSEPGREQNKRIQRRTCLTSKRQKAGNWTTTRVRRTGTGNFSFFMALSEPVLEQIGTEKSLGTGIGKIWYRENVSELVSDKIGTGKKSQNRYRTNFIPELIFVIKKIGVWKIYNGYQYRIGTGNGNFSSFLVVSEPVSRKFGMGKKSWNPCR